MEDGNRDSQSATFHFLLIIPVTFGRFFVSNGWNEEFVAVKP
jgi:hypothetical protein